MSSYEHKELVKRIKRLDELPENEAEYANWINAEGHLRLLRDNAEQEELIIFGSGEYPLHTFIRAVVVSEDSISSVDKDDLLRCCTNPNGSLAIYNFEMGKEDVWIERNEYIWGCKTLKNTRQLVFSRHFDGLQANDSSYFEILQEYAHLSKIHWRPEKNAYCRFDKNGDFEHIVSITSWKEKGSPTLVSFKREPLELYLATSNSVLIRIFNFQLWQQGNTDRWSDGDERKVIENDTLFYLQKVIDGYAGYTRGVQIIRPRRPKAQIFSSFRNQWSGHEDKDYVEFLAYDRRNDRLAKISTDPEATTDYFHDHDNSLPYKYSPVFFRPEVLLKYTGDSDKYTVSERDIHCRGGWMLSSYDVNDAGQVHTYISELQALPHQEQLHWLSYNEKPQAGISERAFKNDFEGEFVDPSPLEEVLSIARRWAESSCAWWKLREEALLERVHIPHTANRDEWASAFGLLANLVIEGFQVKVIRASLQVISIAFDHKEKSLPLLEKYLIGCGKLDNGRRLEGLRTVQLIRSIASSAHPRGGAASDMANNALEEHGTYSAHFESVCRTVKSELGLIEEAFS